MFSLMFALVAAPAAVPPAQAVQATLQSCAMEGGRWVCRYAVPDIEIVPVPGSTIVADAPVAVLGDAPAAPAAPPAPAAAVAAARLDAGILTEGEARLVARCADAGWMSLCLPHDRREARALRDRETAWRTVLQAVTRLLGEGRCDAAVKAALDGGYLDMAREARAFCAPPAGN